MKPQMSPASKPGHPAALFRSPVLGVLTPATARHDAAVSRYLDHWLRVRYLDVRSPRSAGSTRRP